MMQRLGDEASFEVLRTHDRIMRSALAENNGQEVKHRGDGITTAFLSAACTVRCGMAVM